jgi:hypothetical protein
MFTCFSAAGEAFLAAVAKRFTARLVATGWKTNDVHNCKQAHTQIKTKTFIYIFDIFLVFFHVYQRRTPQAFFQRQLLPVKCPNGEQLVLDIFPTEKVCSSFAFHITLYD